MITGYDTAGFAAMCRELAELSGKEMETVIVAQARALLKACIRRTPARKVGAIVKRVTKWAGRIEFSDGRVIQVMKNVSDDDAHVMFLDDSTYTKKKGEDAPRIEAGRTWHMETRRWSNERWNRFQVYQERAKVIKKAWLSDKLAARGLAKKSWFQALAQLGLTSGIPAYVKNACGPGGKQYHEAFADKLLERAAFYIEIRNANRLVVGKLNGAEILAGAIRDRLKAFAIEIENGVFSDIATRAKRYPGIFTN